MITISKTQPNNDNTYCIYCHINKVNGKIYIGQTVHQNNLTRRWGINGIGYKQSKYFYHAIQKYGWDNFKHIVILTDLTREEANIIEVLLIDKYNTTNPDFGYNLQSGGVNGVPNDIAREKMSKSQKNRKVSEETREKIRNFQKSYWTDNKRKEMSESHKGKKHHLYGKHHSEDTKKKMSVKKKDIHWINKDNNTKMVKTDELQKYLTDGWLLGRGHYDRNKSNNNSPKVN